MHGCWCGTFRSREQCKWRGIRRRAGGSENGNLVLLWLCLGNEVRLLRPHSRIRTILNKWTARVCRADGQARVAYSRKLKSAWVCFAKHATWVWSIRRPNDEHPYQSLHMTKHCNHYHININITYSLAATSLSHINYPIMHVATITTHHSKYRIKLTLYLNLLHHIQSTLLHFMIILLSLFLCANICGADLACKRTKRANSSFRRLRKIYIINRRICRLLLSNTLKVCTAADFELNAWALSIRFTQPTVM